MKHFTKKISLLLIFAFVAGLALSSCRILMGDPRKNCNHPQHGQYMKEKQQSDFNSGGKRGKKKAFRY